MLFLQLVRALSLQLYVVFLQCLGSSMLSTPIVLESLDSPLLLETVCHPRFLHRVCRSVYLAFFKFICALAPFLPSPVSSTMTRRFVAIDWMTMSGLRDVWTSSGNCSFLSGLLEVSSRFLAVECPASLRCRLAYLLCLL